MKNINKIVELIENENSISAVLVFNFPPDTNTKLLFTPKLENLSFVKLDNKVFISLKNNNFKEFFDSWIIGIELKFNALSNGENLVERFNNEIKELINIGRRSSEISLLVARGMYGELLELKNLILDNLENENEVINAWHKPTPANHDFDFTDQTIEIKTISRSNTKVKISSEYQLEAFEPKPLYLKIFRIEGIDKSDIDSLGLLYNEIIDLLSPANALNFQIKCCEDKFNKYLGPEIDKLNYKFTVIEKKEFIVDQINFPRVFREKLMPGISKVSYDLDISSIENFLV